MDDPELVSLLDCAGGALFRHSRSKSGGSLGCGVHARRAAAAATAAATRRRFSLSVGRCCALSRQRESWLGVAAAASSGVTLDELLPVHDRLRLLP
jgi:hypothetical protein